MLEAWQEDSDWLNSVGKFQEKVTEWNVNCYGHIIRRKKCIMARMEGINKRLVMGPNRCLSKLLQNLWKKYQFILEQEAIFWRQKARYNWVKFGDRNTKFFHLVIVIRRKRNKIESLISERGRLLWRRRI